MAHTATQLIQAFENAEELWLDNADLELIRVANGQAWYVLRENKTVNFAADILPYRLEPGERVNSETGEIRYSADWLNV